MKSLKELLTEVKMTKSEIEDLLWDLENSNKSSNPSDPKKKSILIRKLKKQLLKGTAL